MNASHLSLHRSWNLPILLGAVLTMLPAPSRAGDVEDARVDALEGVGTPTSMEIRGRVLRANGRVPNLGSVSRRLKGATETLRALDTQPVASVPIEIVVDRARYTVLSAEDGSFQLSVEHPALGLAPGVVPLVATPRGASASHGSLHVVPATPHVIVISDIDDTIVRTYVADPARMLGESILRPGAQRAPVPGVGDAYRRARAAGAAAFIYVSGSPRNFHLRLSEYLRAQDIPEGPLVLKDLGDDDMLEQDGYKKARIQHLLQRLPVSRVVLVGDDGERDPEIYADLAARFPARIAGIVIRSPAPGPAVAARCGGCVVVQDWLVDPDVLARLVKSSPVAPPAPAAR